jgi:hypothetical protein
MENSEMLKALSKWVHVNRARKLLGCGPAIFYHWARKGCQPLGGRKLRIKRRKNMGRVGKPRLYIARSDLNALLALPTFTGEHTDAQGKRWLGTLLAAQQYGFSPSCLRIWRTSPCAYLGRRKMKALPLSVMVESGDSRRMVIRFVYSAEDLATCQSGIATDPKWMTGPEARDEFGFSIGTLQLWRKHKGACPYLQGRKLRSFRKPSVIERGGDLKKMKKHCSIHHRRKYSREDLDAILKKVQTIQEVEADPEWPDYREARKLGFCQPTLSTWATKRCPALDRKLATKTQWLWRNNRIMEVTLYSRADLRLVRPGAFPIDDVQPPQRAASQAATASAFAWRSATTKAIYELCYQMRENGKKYDAIREAAQAKFGVVLCNAEINRNAKLYAQREPGLTFSPRPQMRPD